MSKSARVKEYADKLQSKLLEHGFVIHRYDSFSSSSIYLKLDFGVSNSIRISDHKGKKKLHYRYNILTSQCRMEVDKTGLWPMRYYPISNMTMVVRDILKAKDEYLAKYGSARYAAHMQELEAKSATSPGFWHGARLIGGTE